MDDILQTQPPIAIQYPPPVPAAPAEITFSAIGSLTNDTSASYVWDFGEGDVSGKNVKHLFVNPGSYNIKLTMTDGVGQKHIVTQTVMLPNPAIHVGYPEGYTSLKRSFSTPDSAYVKACSWDYGDGTEPGHGCAPESPHRYGASGSYEVALTLTLNDDTEIQASLPIYVGPGTRYIYGHAIYNDETWYSGGTYVVQGEIVVAEGATLTIEPGTIVKFERNSGIYVYGTLSADGSPAEKIIFTHVTDDTYGGDTNGDGSASHPGVYHSRSPYGSQQANERLIFDIGSSTPSSWLAPGCQIHSTA